MQPTTCPEQSRRVQAVGSFVKKSPEGAKETISYIRIPLYPVPRPNPDARIGRTTHRI